MNKSINVDFCFQGREDIGGDTVTIPLNSTVDSFKEVVQSMFRFPLEEYQVQYDSRLRKNNENFEDFWSSVDNKEVFFIRPSIAGA